MAEDVYIHMLSCTDCQGRVQPWHTSQRLFLEFRASVMSPVCGWKGAPGIFPSSTRPKPSSHRNNHTEAPNYAGTEGLLMFSDLLFYFKSFK